VERVALNALDALLAVVAHHEEQALLAVEALERTRRECEEDAIREILDLAAALAPPSLASRLRSLSRA
jgi:hypothetical protein